MPFAPKPDILGKVCKVCGVALTRKRYRNTLESYDRYLAREHCSQSCANTKADVGKSAHHLRARKHRQDACEHCGAVGNLHVHHKDRDPFNDDPGNLLTLCDSCHLKLHWREDREKRLAANPKRTVNVCVVCGASFAAPRMKKQTCSPQCKSALLSRSQPVTASGCRGVYWDAPRSKWQARIKRDGRWQSAGRFETAEEAAAAIAAIEASGAA